MNPNKARDDAMNRNSNIGNIVNSLSKYIKVGWRPIFAILYEATFVT